MLNGKRHDLYIAKRILNSDNEYNEYPPKYEKPIHYNFLYMPSKSQLDYQKWGEDISRIYIAYINYNIYRGKFHIGDKAYLLDSEMQDVSVANDDINCENANYIIVGVDEQNMFIKITFEKIQ